MANPYISFKDITIRFGNKIIVENFNLCINSGDRVVFKGPSGKGKSTLLQALLGFQKNWGGGQIFFKGRIVDKHTIGLLRRSLSYTPQEVNFYKGTALDFIMLPFAFKNNTSLRPDMQRIKELGQLLELDDDIFSKDTQMLSGGEKQRIALISSMLLQKSIWLLDEPTSALDSRSRALVADMILKPSAQTIISASHDDYWIEKCNKIIEL